MTGILIYVAIVICTIPLIYFGKAISVKRYTALAQEFGGKVVPNSILGQPLLVIYHNDQQIILTSALVKRGGKDPEVCVCSYFPKTALMIVNDHSAWNDPWLFNSIQSWSFGIGDKRFDVTSKFLDWRNIYRPEFKSRLSGSFNIYGNSEFLNLFLTQTVCDAILKKSSVSPLEIRFHPSARWNGKQYEFSPIPSFDIMTPSRGGMTVDREVLRLMLDLIPALDKSVQEYQATLPGA